MSITAASVQQCAKYLQDTIDRRAGSLLPSMFLSSTHDPPSWLELSGGDGDDRVCWHGRVGSMARGYTVDMLHDGLFLPNELVAVFYGLFQVENMLLCEDTANVLELTTLADREVVIVPHLPFCASSVTPVTPAPCSSGVTKVLVFLVLRGHQFFQLAVKLQDAPFLWCSSHVRDRHLLKHTGYQRSILDDQFAASRASCDNVIDI
jgi:hypothetical protein